MGCCHAQKPSAVLLEKSSTMSFVFIAPHSAIMVSLQQLRRRPITFRRVAELVDVSILNEAIGSFLGENPDVCCFFTCFLYTEDSLGTAPHSLRAIEGILKDEDHYGRFLPLTVALIVDRVAMAARFDYVELLATLIVLDVLRDDVPQLPMSAVHASLMDIQNH
jgi:hypothetical protein